jgi:hypothetical protein
MNRWGKENRKNGKEKMAKGGGEMEKSRKSSLSSTRVGE